MEERITANTVAMMPVHTFGQPCEMDEIMEIVGKYELKVLEDCAEAHFATYKGRKVGSLFHLPLWPVQCNGMPCENASGS